MDQHLLANLLAWSAQVLCLAALGALLPAVLRVEAPRVRHAYYRALLVLCLALPWLQSPQESAAGTGGMVSASVASEVAGVAVGSPEGAVSSGLPWLSVLAGMLVAVALMRLAWIGTGLWRLRRLRAAGSVAVPCREHDELQDAVRSRAEIRIVPGLSQPVTFGVWRPVVLLPDALSSQAEHVRRAVLCHELIHVRRRDWLWLLLEEGVRAVLWFHPAVWWLVSRVQLTREEVVDELTVRVTGSRRSYAEALVAFADEIPLVPAAAFGRRRHLLRRVRLVSRSVTMSWTRMALSGALMAVLVAGGGWLAAATFPLTAAAQDLVRSEMGPLERQARPITPENPLPRRIASADPLYPVDAMGIDARGTVTLMITVDAVGRVAEIRSLEERITSVGAPGASPQAVEDALEAMAESAARAVGLWQFDPPIDAPIAIRVSFTFAPDEVRLVSYRSSPVVTAPLGLAETVIVQDTATERPDAGREPSRVPGVSAPSGRAGAIESAAATGSTSAPIRVGGNVRAPRKTRHVSPVYPDIAQSARVEGIVILEAVIDAGGRVAAASLLRSIPLLDQAALDAVRQWEFEPTRLNGVAVPVIMTVTVQFTLSDRGEPPPPPR